MKAYSLLLMIALLLATLAGCERSKPAADGKLHVLCSTYPLYIFTRNITAGNDGVLVEPLLPAAQGCPHEYSLKPEDMKKIARSDIFIANGLGMEVFLGEPLKAANPKIKVIDSSQGVEGILPMMAQEHADGDGSTASSPPNGHKHGRDNPHLFASPAMAAKVVRVIAAQLGQLDPKGAELYKKNADAYAAKFEALDAEFKQSLKDVPKERKKIVTEHAVFDYLARDCGLEIVAVIEEAEPGMPPATPSEIGKVVAQIKKGGAAAMFTEPQYNLDVSRTIARDAGIPAEMLATLDPVANGQENPSLDYYEVKMRENLKTLVKTLSAKAK